MKNSLLYSERPMKCDKCDNEVLYLDEDDRMFKIYACPICGKRFFVRKDEREQSV